MAVSAIIQARMASGRLPGKAALPLDGVPVIKHSIRRAHASSIVGEVVVATTFHGRDDLIAQYARDEGAKVYRGSEDDVLGRLYRASTEAESEAVIRLTGDNPLVPPELIDAVGERVVRGAADYASNKLERTFPLGADAEALTTEILASAEESACDPYYREHATKYIRDHESGFDVRNVTVSDVYDDPDGVSGSGIRLTLDEVPDYELFSELYERIEYDDVIDLMDAVRLVRDEELYRINEGITQETL